MKLKSITEIFPITLLGFYMILFFFVDYIWYAKAYETLVEKTDTVLLIISILGAVKYFKEWKAYTKLSFITVVLLNILTEISFDVEINNYYIIYRNTIVIFFICMIGYEIKDGIKCKYG